MGLSLAVRSTLTDRLKICSGGCGGGGVAQWSELLQLKREALGSVPSSYPFFFFFSSSWLTNEASVVL